MLPLRPYTQTVCFETLLFLSFLAVITFFSMDRLEVTICQVRTHSQPHFRLPQNEGLYALRTYVTNFCLRTLDFIAKCFRLRKLNE